MSVKIVPIRTVDGSEILTTDGHPVSVSINVVENTEPRWKLVRFDIKVRPEERA